MFKYLKTKQELFFDEATKSNSVAKFRTYLKKYPNGKFIEEAKKNIEKLEKGEIIHTPFSFKKKFNLKNLVVISLSSLLVVSLFLAINFSKNIFDFVKNINNQDIANQDIANQDITNEDITNEDITNEDITNEDITNEDITNEGDFFLSQYQGYKLTFYSEERVKKSVNLSFTKDSNNEYIITKLIDLALKNNLLKKSDIYILTFKDYPGSNLLYLQEERKLLPDLLISEGNKNLNNSLIIIKN
ncbi:MAG: hypothetical protein CSA15_07415 [Candidatus Delongbacteria bacterium]|nr:MAG: hypothetical protein CSA15_07415 [Candidatus Delongbacteria bacterium]